MEEPPLITRLPQAEAELVAQCTFARRYADQTEADHAALVAAVERGRLPVEHLS